MRTACAQGPFLACLFRGRNGVRQATSRRTHWHACGVGFHVEHQLHQTGDQVAVGRHGIERTHGLPVNLQAQGRQRFQPEQCGAADCEVFRADPSGRPGTPAAVFFLVQQGLLTAFRGAPRQTAGFARPEKQLTDAPAFALQSAAPKPPDHVHPLGLVCRVARGVDSCLLSGRSTRLATDRVGSAYRAWRFLDPFRKRWVVRRSRPGHAGAALRGLHRWSADRCSGCSGIRRSAGQSGFVEGRCHHHAVARLPTSPLR